VLVERGVGGGTRGESASGWTRLAGTLTLTAMNI
jgi:hypothetical protein